MTKQYTDNNEFFPSGDGGLIVKFDQEKDTIRLAHALARQLKLLKIKGIIDFIPGFESLLVQYDPLIITSAELQDHITPLLQHLDMLPRDKIRHWRIPVCYEGDYAPDMLAVAEALNISPEEVIALHTSQELEVMMLGFLPGLAYMQGVNEKLFLPRQSTPRQQVPALSLGIAMDQTVIYPIASPGGWNLIGRAALRPYDLRLDDPILFKPGDKISFFAINSDEYARELA